ncbi:alpha/beta fold hydrolase [Actinokineospora sp. 24-640]
MRGAPIVYVLHGLLGTAYGHFSHQIRAWDGRYQVVPVDLPGHGRCPLDAGEEYLDQAYEYLAALVARFGPGRMVAASYLGSPLAVRCAERHPELVTSLALTGFAPDMDRETFLRLLENFPRLVAANPELAREYDRLHTPRWRHTLAMFSAHAEAAFEERALVRGARLGALAADTILVNGTLKSVEREAAERAGDLGPRVRGRVLDGAGHIASHDAPEQFTRAVEEFWLRADLGNLLQEKDSGRSLDSLETITVVTYLKGLGLAPDESMPERPTTIEGWGAWAAQRSLVS